MRLRGTPVSCDASAAARLAPTAAASSRQQRRVGQRLGRPAPRRASTSVTSPFGGSANRSASVGRAAALDLLVQLGQLAADGHPPLGVAVRPGARAWPAAGGATRRRRSAGPAGRAGRAAPPARPPRAAGSRRTRSRRRPSRRPPARSSPRRRRAARPARRPAAIASDTTSRAPGSETAGMPASVSRQTRCRRPRSARSSAGVWARLVVLVQRDQRQVDAVPVRAACASGACPRRRPRRRARSSSSTRSVMSARLPIGVGQTTRAPGRSSGHSTSAAAPSTPASLPSSAATIRAPGGRRQHAALVLLAGRRQQQLARPRDPAADHHHLGVEDVDQVGDADAEVAADDRAAPRCASLVAGPGVLDHVARVQVLAGRARGRQARRGDASEAICWPAAITPVADASTSRQPRLGQWPWQGGPFSSIDMWPSSAPGADRAAVELAVQHQAAADAGAQRQHHHVVGRRARRRSATRPGRPRWRRCRSSTGTPSRARHLGHEVEVLERHVGRVEHAPVALVDLRGQAEADAADGAVSLRTDSTSRSIASSSAPWLRRSVGHLRCGRRSRAGRTPARP